MLISHGVDTATDRQLFSLCLDSTSQIPPALDVGSTHFVCLVAWDSKESTLDVVDAFAKRLLDLGAAYVMAWGDGCERLHDVFDETLTDPTRATSAPDDSVIVTTSHESESLDDALYFFLNCSRTHEYYESLISASVAVSIGRSDWCQAIQRALAAPRAFTDFCLDQDDAE